MTQLSAVASAVLYGIADFSGGLASRMTSPWTVTAWSQLLGLPLLCLGLLVVSAPSISASDLAYGAMGGLFGLIGIVALYAALAAGTMSIVSPVTGALSAMLPVAWGLSSGESIAPLQWIGIGIAITSVAMIASDRSDARLSSSVIVLSLVASLGFAAFFIALSQTSPDAGMWPLAASRIVTVPVAFALAATMGVASVPAGRSLKIVTVAGNGDMAANIAILIALQRGPLGVNSVLVSLYPAVTVIAAMVVLGERPTSVQRVGIVLALCAAVALSV
jgi:drug/metabolite transporter (DMT)-like permease